MTLDDFLPDQNSTGIMDVGARVVRKLEQTNGFDDNERTVMDHIVKYYQQSEVDLTKRAAEQSSEIIRGLVGLVLLYDRASVTRTDSQLGIFERNHYKRVKAALENAGIPIGSMSADIERTMQEAGANLGSAITAMIDPAK